MKAMVCCANCWNWFKWDCVDYKEIPRKDGLDYIYQECQNVKGRESNCGNEVGATVLEIKITTTKRVMHPIPSSTANSKILHKNSMIHIKNSVSHMSNNDSKYTTELCDIKQHDKEECHYFENEDNHFEPSKIVLSDKCMPTIRSARLGENTNEHNLNQICLDEFEIKGHANSIQNDGVYSGCFIDYKQIKMILLILLQHMVKTKNKLYMSQNYTNIVNLYMMQNQTSLLKFMNRIMKR